MTAILLVAKTSAGAAFAADHVRSFQGVRIAITIDDFPESGKLVEGWTRASIVDSMIAALRKSNVGSAYGFALGSYSALHPEELLILEKWRAAGYALGNHTYSHPHLNSVTVDEFVADIRREDAVLKRFDGGSQTPRQRRTLRYPYLDEGDTLQKRDSVRRYLLQNGYRVAEVTTNYDDWAWSSAYARCASAGNDSELSMLRRLVVTAADTRLAQSVQLARFLFHRDPPQVLLIHLNAFTALTLRSILAHWAAEGVQFVSLDAALADKVFQIDPKFLDECAACAGAHGRPFFDRIALARHIDMERFMDRTFSVEQIDEFCAATH
jgi:peptidoglycan-N-acetylglucosamine deacetylase